MGGYFLTVAIALDILANALTGGAPYTTISCRIGESIQAGGFWAHIPMPAFARNHFLAAVFSTTV